MILPNNNFAVLLDEDRYGELSIALNETDNISTIFRHKLRRGIQRVFGIGIERTYQLTATILIILLLEAGGTKYESKIIHVPGNGACRLAR